MEPTVIHNTFVIERSYPVPVQRVFQALSDPAKKRRWFVESGGHEVQDYQMDFRVGGREQARFRFKPGSPVQGLTCVNDTTFSDIVADRRVVLFSTMSVEGKCISASLVTFELLPSGTGTDLILTNQGAYLEGADGPEMRKDGWQKLLDRLPAEFDA
jgi:uncharacterized protein YndB with AHSA1/START domain